MEMKNRLDLKHFAQIAIIVEDIEKAAKEWSEILGVEPEFIDQPKPDGPIPGLTYRGKECSYGLRLAVLTAPQGFIIELHQCTDDCDSTFREFVKKHGYGVHHLGFLVGDKRDAVVAEFKDRGYELRTEGIYPDGSWTVIDTEEKLGVNLNVKPHM